MKRGHAIACGVVALGALLLVAIYQLWLRQQPPEIRFAVESMSIREFVEAVRENFYPSTMEDNARFGRREYPGRGHSPWVMRSSLDGRPRVLSLALAPELWLAYSTETASIHQFWRGALNFAGPAFDARHGAEPMSEGDAYFVGQAATAWRVRANGEWQPAQVQWRGHGFDLETGAVWLRFAISDGAGNARVVVERPEWIDSGATGESNAPALRLGLERRFFLDAVAGPAVGLVLGADAGELETRGRFDTTGELLVLESGETQLEQWFDAPTIAIVRETEHGSSADPFADHDCSTCHAAHERIVGPAWGEIARRYHGANRGATVAQLATSIVEGSRGRWGDAPMIPHPDLGRGEAAALAARILDTEAIEAAEPQVAAEHEAVPRTYDFDVESRPDALHPSLTATPIHAPEFRPQVGGLALLPDGRLLVSTWDRDGAVLLVEGWDGPAEDVHIERIAEGLHEPLGIAVADGEVYVIQKQEITQLLDHDGDDQIDEYRTLTNDWRVTSNFHEFGFGLARIGRSLYAGLSVCVLRGGKSCRDQTPDRGKLIRVSLDTGQVEFIASGLRTPNGLAVTRDGALLVTDNQGDWLPSSKLIRVEFGGDYGWRPPGEVPDPALVTPPALWLPQHEIGNSPTQPVELSHGPYAGAVLFGDIYNGGIKRAVLEEIGGQLQGAAFHFTGGLQGSVHRLIEAPGGELVAGQVGSHGNWGEADKQRFGLEVLRFGDETAFEPLQVSAVPGGFEITFTRPLHREVEPAPEHFALQQWYYVPTESYGGPKYDVTELDVRSATLSPDRRRVSIAVDGLEAERVVYLRMDRALRSANDETLWVNEAWYTMNVRPVSAPVVVTPPVSAAAHNTLTEAEREAGWKLLFDGVSFAGWKIYGADDAGIEGWVIADGALEFTRDVSLAGLVWNHINPFSTAALDLMTRDRFANFELAIDWKTAPGSNSGIFYLVPDETASTSWAYALEMQVLDDERHSDGRLERRRAGDLYDLRASDPRVVHAAGEWNRARIRVRGNHIEHFMNGERVVDIVRGSADWDEAIAASKFAGVEGFGLAREGHITLQDHGDVVWYRNIKIRSLDD